MRILMYYRDNHSILRTKSLLHIVIIELCIIRKCLCSGMYVTGNNTKICNREPGFDLDAGIDTIESE